MSLKARVSLMTIQYDTAKATHIENTLSEITEDWILTPDRLAGTNQ